VSFKTDFPYTAIFLHNVWLVIRVYRYNSYWPTSFQSFETCMYNLLRASCCKYRV